MLYARHSDPFVEPFDHVEVTQEHPCLWWFATDNVNLPHVLVNDDDAVVVCTLKMIDALAYVPVRGRFTQ